MLQFEPNTLLNILGEQEKVKSSVINLSPYTEEHGDDTPTHQGLVSPLTNGFSLCFSENVARSGTSGILINLEYKLTYKSVQ